MSRDRERFDDTISGKKIKTDACYEMGRRHPGTLNTITPCAACKLLRRRCAEECPFSPYFSPQEPHKFAAVHKVFGASNVSKMLMEIPESQRADAANSLIYEANLRLRDPVYGCMGAIVTLQQQVQNLQAELNAVRAEILKYKLRQVVTTSTTTTTSNILIPSRATLISSGTPISIAATSSHIPPTPPPPPRPPPSVVVSSSSSSSTSSLYSSSTSATGYSSISSDNLPYFD